MDFPRMIVAASDGATSFLAIDEAALIELAARLSPLARDGATIYLEGALGVGKTTFARALLRALGSEERVKSPTYSLVESYRIGELNAHHLDLYRIGVPDELEWLGVPDLLESPVLFLVEWPERAGGRLPPADLKLQLRHSGDARDLAATACSARGFSLLRAWTE